MMMMIVREEGKTKEEDRDLITLKVSESEMQFELFPLINELLLVLDEELVDGENEWLETEIDGLYGVGTE